MRPRDIQRLLTAAGYYKGGIDGDFGPKSTAAVRLVLERNKPGALEWSPSRQRIAAAQIILTAAGYEPGTIDGYAGHNTREALNAWEYEREHGKPEILPGRDDDMLSTPRPGAKGKWPKQSDVRAFYGEPGNPNCTAGKCILPTPFKIAWNPSQSITKFSCHIKVSGAFTSLHQEAFRHYGERRHAELRLNVWGGCYNFRKMRGGSSYSMHAWGIAEDLDPENNQLRWGKDRALFARSEYDAFWRIVEAHGATSLGRARNYDWMHFQFAGL